MKEASWNECLETNNAVTISVDKAKAKSFTEIVQNSSNSFNLSR